MLFRSGTGQPSLAQVNMAARRAILGQALPMTQNIYSATITTPGSTGNVINVIPRNVGLITKFTVEITATITNTGATSVTSTNFNIANLLQQIVFNDLNNQTRIQTAGWHMNVLNTIRNPKLGPFGSALVSTAFDVPIKYGNNYGAGTSTSPNGLFSCPASIAATGSTVVKMTYEIPLAYKSGPAVALPEWDLRGAVYANVVNATMLLQLTLNPAPVVASTADGTLALYQGAAGAGSITSATVNVFQHFLDQLPVGKNGPVLPIQDLSTIYEMKNTTLSGMTQNQDFPIAYSNFRDFLSTCVIWDNAGVLTAGTDLNYWALQSANFTNIFKVDPFTLSLWTRKLIQTDVPTGSYYVSHRDKPISTIQYGNLELIQNISASVTAGAQDLIGFEDFALINTISGAGSLAAG